MKAKLQNQFTMILTQNRTEGQGPKPCPDCQSTDRKIEAGAGPHAAKLVCVCGRFIKWIGKAELTAIKAIDRAFKGGARHE